MFLKDHLKDAYKKASCDKNHLMVENIINRWAHRFGIESLNELLVKNQEQFNLIKEEQEEESQEQFNLIKEEQEEESQVNLELFEDVEYKKEIELKSKELNIYNNSESINKDNFVSYENKSECMEIEELPLPNINNLRKWINNEKKAS